MWHVDSYPHVCSDDRLPTHWLRVIGKHAPSAPMVDIELNQRADILISAKAKASYALSAHLCIQLTVNVSKTELSSFCMLYKCS